MVRERGMPRSLTDAIHYHAQLGPPDKGRPVKGLVVCYVVWLRSIGWVFGLVACCGHQDSYRAQVPQHPIDSLEYHI